MEPQTESHLLVTAAELKRKRPELRWGQALLVQASLFKENDFINSILGTDADPFYVDSRVINFLLARRKFYEKQKNREKA